jgi:hypothetical protein
MDRIRKVAVFVAIGALACAIAAHVFFGDAAAEVAGEIAFFSILAASLVPGSRNEDSI